MFSLSRAYSTVLCTMTAVSLILLDTPNLQCCMYSYFYALFLRHMIAGHVSCQNLNLNLNLNSNLNSNLTLESRGILIFLGSRLKSCLLSNAIFGVGIKSFGEPLVSMVPFLAVH